MLYKVHREEATNPSPALRNETNWGGFRMRKRTIPYIEVNSDEATRSSVITAAWCGGSQYMQVLVNPRCQASTKRPGVPSSPGVVGLPAQWQLSGG